MGKILIESKQTMWYGIQEYGNCILTSLVGTVSLVGLTVGDPGTTGFGEGGDTTGLDVGEDVTGDLLGFLVGDSVIIGDSVGDPGATGLREGLSVGSWDK